MSHRLIEDWFPPAIRRAINRVLGAAIVYRGPYRDFASARAATGGYETETIIRRIREATREVLEGKARYEQDGKTFAAEPPPEHALAHLLFACVRARGRLSVLDFGGSLASEYLRWRTVFASIPDLEWSVVEQKEFVAAGREMFASVAAVHFDDDIGAAAARAPNAVLASGSLQYVADPDDCLRRLANLSADTIIIDRLPIREDGAGAVITQHVPKNIYSASYPLHVFSRHWLQDSLGARYELLAQFPARDTPIEAGRIRAAYVGSVWLAKRQSRDR